MWGIKKKTEKIKGERKYRGRKFQGGFIRREKILENIKYLILIIQLSQI